MSFLFLIEDSGLRLSKRSPYSFQPRDTGGLEDGTSGCQKRSDSGFFICLFWFFFETGFPSSPMESVLKLAL